ANTSTGDLNRFRGLSQRFGTTPDQMRAQFQAALLIDPNLTFGQFVSATVVSDNLHSRFPNVTANAIFTAMARGKSLGQALRSLGVPSDDADELTKDADRRMKAAK